ncbi:MAG: hypothetical protein M3304_01325, partial [Actinomycetota bacterium]|nr:hypothetical protein [Actinomycetota bacterium]
MGHWPPGVDVIVRHEGQMLELSNSPASNPVEAARRALDAALAAVAEAGSANSIQAVADEMPVALGVDFANIRVLGLDRRLHLVAASGCTTMEIRRRAFHPLPAAVVRETLATGGHDDVARSLGIPWIRVVWVEGEETLGSIAVGARSKRRPDPSGLRVLVYVADQLAEPFSR